MTSTRNRHDSLDMTKELFAFAARLDVIEAQMINGQKVTADSIVELKSSVDLIFTKVARLSENDARQLPFKEIGAAILAALVVFGTLWAGATILTNLLVAPIAKEVQHQRELIDLKEGHLRELMNLRTGPKP